jgi:hypothetical protein
VVLRGPDADLEAVLREGRDGRLGKPGLKVNATAGCVQPPARNRLACRETLVEHSCGDLDQGATKARPAGRADRELEAAVAQDDTRSHHAAHPVAGLERAADQVGLAEHAVQVQVERWQEVAGAKP